MRRHYGIRSKRKRLGLFKRLVLLMLIILALPFLLVLAYRVVPPPVSALMVLHRIDGQAVDYRWRPAGRISRHLFQAAAVSEDARICQHNGVDWGVLQGLAEEALDEGGKSVRGGSTIAMQTAKNLFLWPQRSYLRKLLEIPISLWIDYIWPKRRIVEVYLNIAEWGPGIYGAEAASRYHFGISAARLSLHQAALLAAALPNPAIFDAGRPGPNLRDRARRVEGRMRGADDYLKCLE